MIRLYLVTLSGIALGQMLPGPNLMAVAGIALSQGRRMGMFVALGSACAVLVWVLVACLGLGALIDAFPGMTDALRIVGGSYLIYLAARAVISSARGGEASFGTGGGAVTPMSAWRRGLLVNLTNPKAAIMWAAVATFLYGAGLSPVQMLGIAPLGALSALVIYGAIAAICATTAFRDGYARFARWVELVFAGLFGLIGVELIMGVRAFIELVPPGSSF